MPYKDGLINISKIFFIFKLSNSYINGVMLDKNLRKLQ